MNDDLILSTLHKLKDGGYTVCCEGMIDYLFFHSDKRWHVYNTSFRYIDVKEIKILPNEKYAAEIIITGDS
jgi:hypothetical protein